MAFRIHTTIIILQIQEIEVESLSYYSHNQSGGLDIFTTDQYSYNSINLSISSFSISSPFHNSLTKAFENSNLQGYISKILLINTILYESIHSTI